MTDLITKLEEAGEGSRELDALVTVALKLDCKPNLPDDLQYLKAIRRDDYCAPGTYWFLQRSGVSLRTSEPVTTSLDAALALASRVLPGWFPSVEPRFFIDGKVVRWKATLIRPLWDQYNPVTDEWFDHIENRTASTPALALCAAILRASEEKQS